MTETFLVHTKTQRSSMCVGTDDPKDALKRAREMAKPGHQVTITDRDGNLHTVEELEANMLSGKYVKPAASVLT